MGTFDEQRSGSSDAEDVGKHWLKAARWMLLVAVCVVYGNSLNNGFHFDDSHAVVDNPAIRSWKNLPELLTDATAFSVLPANRTYRPVVSVSLALDYALGHGYEPMWFHLSTLAWFLLEVYLLGRLYALIFGKVMPGETSEWLGLLGAAWYGLHPVMAETVNYVIQRGDLYCTLGCVSALYVYARWPKLRRAGLYLLPFAIAMLSKPPAAVFPALLLLYVVLIERPGLRRERGRSRTKAGMLAMVPSLAVTALLLGLQSAKTPKTFAPSMLSGADYRMTQPFVWLRYFGELWLPIHLNADTDLQVFHEWNSEAIAGAVFVIALVAAIWWSTRRRERAPIAFGLLWFVVTELPTSLYALSEVENDHRMFFAFVGLMMAMVWAGWLAARWLWTSERRRHLRWVVVGCLLVALGGYAYGVTVRNRVWHDEESLWKDDVTKSPENGRGWMNYGLTQMAKGEYVQAKASFERALLYTPNYAVLEINLGIVDGAMADQGVNDQRALSAEAEHHFLRAVALAPNDDLPHAYYGRWLSEHGRMTEGIAQLTSAVALNPQRLLAHEALIGAYERTGDAVAARQAAAETLALAPDDVVAQRTARGSMQVTAATWINRSLLAYQQGQYQASLAAAQQALVLDPKAAAAWNNVGAAYAGMLRWKEAVAAEQQALRLDPNLQIAKNNLAAYLQQTGSQQPGSQQTGTLRPPAAGMTAEQELNASLALYKVGRYEESIAAARRALKLNAGYAEAWNNIAASNASLHRWDEAIGAAQRAIALKPDFQMAKNNLAWAVSQKQAGVQ